MPKRQRYLFVCTNERPDGHPRGSCAKSGSGRVLEELKRQIKIAGFADRVRTCGSTCLDVCESGVTVAVQPDNQFYGRVTLDDVPEIVASLQRGELVERLIIADAEFDVAPKK